MHSFPFYLSLKYAVVYCPISNKPKFSHRVQLSIVRLRAGDKPDILFYCLKMSTRLKTRLNYNLPFGKSQFWSKKYEKFLRKPNFKQFKFVSQK